MYTAMTQRKMLLDSGVFVRTPAGQTVSYSNATFRICSNFKAETSALHNAAAYIAEMKPQNTVILTDTKAALQSLISNTSGLPIHQLLKDHINAPSSYSGSRPTVWFQKMKEQIAWPSLGANNCNPCPPPLTWMQKPCCETVKNANGEGPLETTTPLQTQSTIWLDMSRPLYSGCEQDTVACERTWSELA